MGGLVSSGPLVAYEAGYVRWLVERGYRPGAVADRLGQFRALSRWLGTHRLPVADLDPGQVEEFLDDRRAAGYRSYVASSSVRLPNAHLLGIGVVPLLHAAVAAAPVDRLLEQYRRYLPLERRLAETTTAGYECVARVFLEHRVARCGGLELERLSAADVSEFVAIECERLTDGAARDQGAKLRPLLVYLHVTGRFAAPVRWAVPKVADMRVRAMPRALEPEAVARLLASCDRQRSVGRSDYAVLLLLVRLGLRSVEVAAMQLEDIDWRAGEILVRAKGGRRDRLLLSADVGEALVGYLQRRPPGRSRAVFVGMLPPGGPLTRQAVGSVVSAACSRAGIPRPGAHRLRHTGRPGCSRRAARWRRLARSCATSSCAPQRPKPKVAGSRPVVRFHGLARPRRNSPQIERFVPRFDKCRTCEDARCSACAAEVEVAFRSHRGCSWPVWTAMLACSTAPTRTVTSLLQARRRSVPHWHLARRERRVRRASAARVPCAESSLAWPRGTAPINALLLTGGHRGPTRLRLRSPCA
jgi:integrase/recombinase XerD